jgi:hypothetical protein
MDHDFIRKRLSELIDVRGLKVSNLSLKAKLGDQRLRHYLAGRINSLTSHDLRNILNVASVTEDQFFDVHQSLTPVAHALQEFYRIPVFGEIPAGNPTWIEGTHVASEYIPGDDRDKRRRAFGL